MNNKLKTLALVAIGVAVGRVSKNKRKIKVNLIPTEIGAISDYPAWVQDMIRSKNQI